MKNRKMRMNRLSHKITLSILTVFSVVYIYGAEGDSEERFNAVQFAIPSMAIAPDARGGGMGDAGAATLPDIYSQYWNPAKYAFNPSKAGLAISLTPWLSQLVNDIYLGYLAGYYKFGEEDQQAVSASIRYFSIGGVDLYNAEGLFQQQISPYEMAFDVAYSRKLSETFAGSIALRVLHTDYTTGDEGHTPGTAFAADVSGYNESYVMLGESECLLGLGFNISNIGTKISNDGGNTNYFIPTNLRLGASLTYPMDEYNEISFSGDINKYLVPTRSKLEGETNTEMTTRYSDMSPIAGMFKSLNDAPGGFKEELKEVNLSLGVEYTYNRQFSVRAGYRYENPEKGNQSYFTAGAGFKMSMLQLDASYLVSSGNSPLDKTLRISVSFDMDGLRNLMK